MKFFLGLVVGALAMLIFLKRKTIAALWDNRDRIDAGLDLIDHVDAISDDVGRLFK